jgi:group I intron endonuclease
MEKEFIYKITSPKGKIYIGRTKDFDGRMAEHKHIALKNKSNYALYRAIRKYGWDNFQKEIICEVDKKIAAKIEEEFILAYDSVKRGYNNTYAGHGGNMFINNPELKEKLRKTLSKKYSGSKNPMFGKSHSNNTKQLQKEKAKGRYSLNWFINRNGDIEGKRLYEERRQWLKNRNLKKDSNGRFISSS